MAFELHDNRTRMVGVVATLCANGLLLLLLLTLARGLAPPTPRQPGLATFDIAPPPPRVPPPPPKRAGAPAPSSRGMAHAPSPPMPAQPLPRPVPTPSSLDAGSQSASGAGSAAGSGAGRGGQGSGSGGAGSGSGAATAPVHVAGALTDADYSRAGLPKGAQGTVVISFRVRKNGGVDSCAVVRSSGYAPIDRDTCQLVEQRFKFRPARDSTGQPIDFTLRTDFTWQPR